MLSSQPQSYGSLPPGAFISQPVAMTLIGLPQHLAVPILLFFAWGVLTALEEIYDQMGERDAGESSAG
jgi:hypothetical protein